MALFESYERRVDKINAALKEYGISSVEECKEIIGIDYEFHYSDGYYETDDWCEGQDKYFRGYCIDLLSNLHKPYNKKLRKELNKINKCISDK